MVIIIVCAQLYSAYSRKFIRGAPVLIIQNHDKIKRSLRLGKIKAKKRQEAHSAKCMPTSYSLQFLCPVRGHNQMTLGERQREAIYDHLQITLKCTENGWSATG